MLTTKQEDQRKDFRLAFKRYVKTHAKQLGALASDIGDTVSGIIREAEEGVYDQTGFRTGDTRIQRRKTGKDKYVVEAVIGKSEYSWEVWVK